jgi:hypothetical protein
MEFKVTLGGSEDNRLARDGGFKRAPEHFACSSFPSW